MRTINYIIAIFFILILTNCESNSSSSTQNQIGDNVKRIIGLGIIKVGTMDNELPWCDRDMETGELIGYEVEIIRLLVEKMNTILNSDIKLEFVSAYWDELPDKLLRRRIDIIGNSWSPTDEYKDKIIWSNPYQIWGLITVIRSNSNYTSIDQLKNLPVGRYDDPVTIDLFNSLGFKNIKLYENGDLGIEELIAGNIEAFIYDSASLEYIAKVDPRIKVIGSYLNQSTYNFGIRKGEEDLLQVVNQALDLIIGSPEYQAIMDKWY
jgi:ABC-type amino acid transport substrate-binding protein